MRVRSRSWWAVLWLGLPRPSFAASEPPAIWYRASESCPDGAEFLEKLAETARPARLAEAGDHIDFVVTLVANRDQTVGRLERQTDGGIVAIRELRDATCERVADALALSLGLALTPGQGAEDPTPDRLAADPGARGAPSATLASPPPPPARPPPPPPPPVPVASSDRSVHATEPAEHAPSAGRQWSLGVGLGPMIGISTQPLPRGEFFIHARPALGQVLPNLSLRAGVVGARGSSETAIGSVQRWILAGRAEACPVAWRAGRFGLQPCFAFELGATGASADGGTGVHDRSLWAAPAGQLRLALALFPDRLWLEASGGALVPLRRNEIFVGSSSLYRDAPAVFHAGFGISLRLP